MNPTLTSSLKWLAENEPEKYTFGKGSDRSFWFGWHRQSRVFAERRVQSLTQDDVDEILAGVGMEYSLSRAESFDSKSGLWGWKWFASVNEINEQGFAEIPKSYPSKREAAIAALVAGIERKKKEDPKP